MKPRRIQLSRRKGWRMPPNTISVARPHRWGNPHEVGYCSICGVKHSREEAIRNFKADLSDSPELLLEIRQTLRGKNLACWCPLDKACHADVLLSLANPNL